MEKSAEKQNEETAVQRWENEGGEVINLARDKTNGETIFIDRIALPTTGSLIKEAENVFTRNQTV